MQGLACDRVKNRQGILGLDPIVSHIGYVGAGEFWGRLTLDRFMPGYLIRGGHRSYPVELQDQVFHFAGICRSHPYQIDDRS